VYWAVASISTGVTSKYSRATPEQSELVLGRDTPNVNTDSERIDEASRHVDVDASAPRLSLAERRSDSY